MHVFLIRHPRPLINPGICYGQLDIDCESPQPIAARLKSLLPANTPVISSPLHRARVLAEPLAGLLGSQMRIDARITESDFGKWEGKPWDAIDRSVRDAWMADIINYTPPGGESVARVQQRVIEFANSLDEPRVALVTHAGVMRVLLGYWQNLPVAEWTQLKFDYGSMTEIEIGRP